MKVVMAKMNASAKVKTNVMKIVNAITIAKIQIAIALKMMNVNAVVVKS